MHRWAEYAAILGGIVLVIWGLALERRSRSLGSGRMGLAILLVLAGLGLVSLGAVRLLLPWIFGGHVG